VCLLEWTVTGDTTDLTGFTITRDVVHGGTSSVSISLPGTARRHQLTNLQASTEYAVCITVTRSGSTSAAGTHVCTSVWTNAAPEQPKEDEYRRLLTIILGSIFAGTLLVVVVAIVVVLLRRHYARRPRKAAANASSSFDRARSTTTRPQVGFGSKRFAKDGGVAARNRKSPRTVSTVSGNGREQTKSAAFTPEEREKILAMLAGTPVPGYSPRAFSNAAYEPGSNEHVYDAIPGEGFYDVPLDSAV